MKEKDFVKIVITASDEAERNAAVEYVTEKLKEKGCVAFSMFDGDELKAEPTEQRAVLISSGAELERLCAEGGDTEGFEIGLRDSYDAVFILEGGFTDGLISLWTGTPHLRIVSGKKALLREMLSFLGIPAPLEAERKYLIEYPDIQALSTDPFCRMTEIWQTYLKSCEGIELRVRKRGERGVYQYFRTEKRKLCGIKRQETEERICEGEYLRLLENADPERRTIEKHRYCLVYGGRYYEIDVYPFWNDRAILEIELSEEAEEVPIPPMLRVIREVTHDEAYKNSYLARRLDMDEGRR